MEDYHSEDTLESSEQTTGSPVHEHLLPDPEDGIEPEFVKGEPMSRSPAQEHLLPTSQQGRQSSVAVANDEPSNELNGQATAPGTRSLSFHPIDTVTGEDPHAQYSDGLSQHGWEDSNRLRTRYPSARNSSPSQSGPHRYTMRPDPWINASSTTAIAVSTTDTVVAPLQDRTCLARIQGPHPPPVPVSTELPSFSELVESIRCKPTLWPDPNDSQRLSRGIGNGECGLVRGPTQCLGPPLKPFDGQKFEEEAQKQFGSVMRLKDGLHDVGGRANATSRKILTNVHEFRNGIDHQGGLGPFVNKAMDSLK